MNNTLTSISAEDLSSQQYRHDLMQRHEEFDQMLSGVDSDGCDVTVSINSDNITVTTFQHNGWACTKVYWADGDIEESFEKWSQRR